MGTDKEFVVAANLCPGENPPVDFIVSLINDYSIFSSTSIKDLGFTESILSPMTLETKS